MSDLDQDTINSPSRRGLFARFAGAAAIGIAGLTARSARAATAADGPDWPGKLEGRHRQVVDAYEVNGGFPLAFAWTFLMPNPEPGAATAVVVLRHSAFPLALNHAMWAKYKIGESFKIDDPETKATSGRKSLLPAKAWRSASGRLRDRPAVGERHDLWRVQNRAGRAERYARPQCRRERGRSCERMDGERDTGDHARSIGNMGREPRAGSWLHLLRGRLTMPSPVSGTRTPGLPAKYMDFYVAVAT